MVALDIAENPIDDILATCLSPFAIFWRRAFCDILATCLFAFCDILATRLFAFCDIFGDAPFASCDILATRLSPIANFGGAILLPTPLSVSSMSIGFSARV
jgi:hypothetical protein